MFRRKDKDGDDDARLREALAENARLIGELGEMQTRLRRAEWGEARWAGVAAALGALVQAIEGRWVPSAWWTLRPLSRRDVATDATLHELRRRYEGARALTERP